VEPQGGVINVVSKVGKELPLVLDWISKTTTAEAELETEILELEVKTSKF
jgi:hypothetical protein